MLFRSSTKLKLLLSFGLLLGCLSLKISLPNKASAYIDNPNVPNYIEQALDDSCPGPGQPGQTGHIVYFSPTTISSKDGTGNTGVYGTSLVCNDANYSDVTEIHISVYSIVRTAGNGNVSLSSNDFYPPDIHSKEYATGPASGTAFFTNLSPGQNCWNFYFNASAKYGGSTSFSNAPGSNSLCITYNQVYTELGSCDVLTIAGINPDVQAVVLSPGQAFQASFNVSNQGTTAWPVGQSIPPTVPGDPGPQSSRYKLGSYNAFSGVKDGTEWGPKRLELWGVSTGFGPIHPAGTTIGPETYNFTAPNTPGTYVFGWRILKTGGNDLVGQCAVAVTVAQPPPPPPNLSCGGISPTSAEEGVGFTLGVSFSNGPGSSTLTGARLSVTVTNSSGSTVFTNANTSFTPNPLPANTSATGNNSLTLSPAGDYTVKWTVSGGNTPTTLNCSQPLPVARRPFFTLRNGDMGVGTAKSCTGWGPPTSSNPSILVWNNNASGPSDTGPGTNLAVYALKLINGFASAQQPSGSASPRGLMFANTQPQFGTGFGGNLSGGIPCPTDYYATLSNILPSQVASLGPSTSVLDSDQVFKKTNGNLTITGGTVAAGTASTAGHRPTIFVKNHDVFISGDIVFSGSAGSVGQLQNFYLIVSNGNIYIKPSVSQLYGVYVAQPDSSGNNGKIYTCSSGAAPPTSSAINNNCSSTVLNVFGAFEAKELKLYRSTGTVGRNTPAEIFTTTTNTWLATPCVIADNCSSNGSVWKPDAITSLPPIL